MSTPLPCPFCGTNPVVETYPGGPNTAPFQRVQCPQCNVGFYDAPPHALPAWNRRTLGRVLTAAARDVLFERVRQISDEGWTAAHDDAHTDGSLAQAAACYATPPEKRRRTGDPRCVPVNGWPNSWHPSWWKPKDHRRDLIRAAALILAEIERLDRLTAKGGAV